MSNLYKRSNYLNKVYDPIFNVTIKEYDMKDAGFNIIKDYELLDKETIEYLESLNKMDKNVSIGKLQARNRDLLMRMLEGFENARKVFIEENKLEDKDILSIKKDSITVINKSVTFTDITERIKFREKGNYTSFIVLNKNIEIYKMFGDNCLNVRIKQKDLDPHKDFFLEFILSLIVKRQNLDTKGLMELLRDFRSLYLSRKLDIGYYREFNADSQFKFSNDLTGSIIFLYRKYK